MVHNMAVSFRGIPCVALWETYTTFWETQIASWETYIVLQETSVMSA